LNHGLALSEVLRLVVNASHSGLSVCKLSLNMSFFPTMLSQKGTGRMTSPMANKLSPIANFFECQVDGVFADDCFF
jgi:hypothetical protein